MGMSSSKSGEVEEHSDLADTKSGPGRLSGKKNVKSEIKTEDGKRSNRDHKGKGRGEDSDESEKEGDNKKTLKQSRKPMKKENKLSSDDESGNGSGSDNDKENESNQQKGRKRKSSSQEGSVSKARRTVAGRQTNENESHETGKGKSQQSGRKTKDGRRITRSQDKKKQGNESRSNSESDTGNGKSEQRSGKGVKRTKTGKIPKTEIAENQKNKPVINVINEMSKRYFKAGDRQRGSKQFLTYLFCSLTIFFLRSGLKQFLMLMPQRFFVTRVRQ
jgi:hypothetical protein